MILSGEVLLEQINMAGRQTYAEYLGERQQFGVVDLFLKRKQYSYSARARSHVKPLKISSHFSMERVKITACTTAKFFLT
ncbi:MAG: hypothetical protein ACLR8Q_01100 [[Ruminococcus] lactaris]|uniref:hypothetical protein n=1 Tax=[Ruminococcus] lactaris TaxID=46228 RepID=UPI0039A0B1EB